MIIKNWSYYPEYGLCMGIDESYEILEIISAKDYVDNVEGIWQQLLGETFEKELNTASQSKVH